jgi:AcrR family transcriptional regulator
MNKYDKILSVAAKLIAKKGYPGTSFQEIADKVNLHKSSLFHYFNSKEELLLKILERPVDEVNLNLKKIVDSRLEPAEKLKMAIHNHLILLTDYIENVNIYLNETRSLSKQTQSIYLKKRKNYERDFMEIIAEMKTKGYFKGLDSKIVTFAILGMMNWLVKWHKKDGAFKVKEIADTFYRMIVMPKQAPK